MNSSGVTDSCTLQLADRGKSIIQSSPPTLLLSVYKMAEERAVQNDVAKEGSSERTKV